MPPYLRLVRTEPPRAPAPARLRTKRPGGRPTPVQLEWLRRGLDRPGGNLPLYDSFGQRVSDRTMKSCVEHGWATTRAEAMRNWQLCQLTSAGREVLDAD
jgi:hypothetical protein